MIEPRKTSALARAAATLTTLAAAAALAIPSFVLPTWALPPTQSEGTYLDSAGAPHHWKVNIAHTLFWDDTPFLPVGGLFQAQSWVKGSTDDDFAADTAALAQIKAHGVTNLIVQPARGGITNVTPEAIQKLLDTLDSMGFTYGISLNDGPREPLSAYEILPGAYRQTLPEGGGALRFPADNLVSALYLIANQDGRDVLSNGEAEMVADGARVNVPSIAGQSTLTYLFPEKMYPAGSDLGLPNLWDGYDAYRDSLLTLFGKVRLGKGFRFFIDPLPMNMALTEQTLRLVPDSAGFSEAWGNYLSQKYRSMQNLDDAWQLTDRDVPNFDTAAKLIPLWNGGKGLPFLYDHGAHKRYATDAGRTAFWSDFRDFTTNAMRLYMSDLGTALKHGIADVPVVYRSQGWSPLFAHLRQAEGDSGFDGIGIVAYGRGRDLITNSAGEIYAQASEAPKTLWLPVTGTSDAGPEGTAKTTKGYSSRGDLYAGFDQLREIGARGFYVDSLRTLDPARANFNLLDAPDQLSWLTDYQQLLSASGVRPGTSGSNLDTLPGVTYYPRNLDAGTVRLLGNGEWWLPSDRPGVAYDFGPTVHAYALTDADGSSTYYIWNPLGGRRTIRIKLPPQSTKLPNAPKVQWSAEANGTVRDKVLTLTIGPDPIRLINYPTVPLPLDAFDESFKVAIHLSQEMHRRNQLESGKFSSDLPQIQMDYKKRDPWYGYGRLQEAIARMRTDLRDYAWLEAEGSDDFPAEQSFDAIEAKPAASGGRVLVVGQRGSGMPLATAAYNITVNESGTYQLWVAASPNAPLTFRLDGQSLLDDANIIGRIPDAPGATYAGGTLAWTHLGPVNLPKGSHRLEMRASGPAVVDALLLYKGQFVPNGTTLPPVAGE